MWKLTVFAIAVSLGASACAADAVEDAGQSEEAYSKVTSFRAGVCESATICNVVQPSFEHGQKSRTSHTFHSLSLFKKVSKLSFLKTVHSLNLLFLTKLKPVFRKLNTT